MKFFFSFVRYSYLCFVSLLLLFVIGLSSVYPQNQSKPYKRIQPAAHPSSGLSEKELFKGWRHAHDFLQHEKQKRFQTQSIDQHLDATLLIDEGFEGGIFPPTGWSTAVVAGSPDWTWTTTPHSGNNAAYSEFGPPATASKKYLITKRITLNSLVQYRLTFWVQRDFDSTFAPDTIYVKLATADSTAAHFATTLYKCYTGPNTSTSPDVYTTTYKQFSVSFTGISGTVWLAFDHEDNNGQGINLDDVQLDEIVNNDILALSVDQPSAGARKNISSSFQPKATFKNNGLMTQTNIPVRMKILNGGTVEYDNVQTISSLAPNATTQVTFDSFTPSTSGTHTARVRTENSGDANASNDSIAVQFYIAGNISGVKTVGPSGNFSTIADAIRFLKNNNVAGPLTFSLTGSTYNELPLSIDSIIYTTTPQPILFKPSTGVSPYISISATPNAPYGLRFSGVSLITFDGANGNSATRDVTLDLDTTGLSSPAVLIINGCNNITLKNLKVKGYINSIQVPNSAILIDTPPSQNDQHNIVFDNILTTRAFNGFFLNASSAKSRSITILHCEMGGADIDAITQAGIVAYNIDSLVAMNNDIHDVSQVNGTADLYGIFLGGGSTSAIIRSNKIHAVNNFVNSYFAYGIDNEAGAGSNVFCYNNFIDNIIAAGGGTNENWSFGIYNGSTTTGARYYYNSMYLYGYDSSSSAYSHSGGFGFELGSSSFQVVNNAVVNAMTFGNNTATNKAYAIHISAGPWPSGSTANYNDFYTPNAQGIIGFVNNSNQALLSNWQIASGQDANSISANPLFVGQNDLHIVGSTSPADSHATPLLDVAKDIDGESRNTSTPDIGADEYTANHVFATGAVLSRWNIVSLPVKAFDPRVRTIFPGAATTYAFGFSSGYVKTDSLVPGKGYWLKFLSSQQVSADGQSLNPDTINVSSGWSMIGSTNYAIATSSITSIPPGIISSHFFGYSNGYAIPDSLQPFNGYWVKVSQAGKLVISTSGVKNGASPNIQSSANKSSAMNALTICDAGGNEQTLYFSTEYHADRFSDELPPLPPQGTFDARFATNTLTVFASEGKMEEFPIVISSPLYPLTIRWEITTRPQNPVLSLDGKEISLRQDGVTSIAQPLSHMSLKLRGFAEIPKQFALEQNYPNPFNPSTVIRYQLPVRQDGILSYHVTLRIYNVLGQLVETLRDGVEETGYKSVEWKSNGSVASGVYFYTLEASSLDNPKKSFLQTRKLVLLR